AVETIKPLLPEKPSRVQSIPNRVVVRQGHVFGEVLRPEPGRIDLRKVGAGAGGEEIHRVQVKRLSAGGSEHVSGLIDGRCCREGIAVGARCAAGAAGCEISKNTLSGGGGQNGGGENLLAKIPLVVGDKEEEQFVLLDGAADAAAELVAVGIVIGLAVQILEERGCVEVGVVIAPEQRAVIFIAAGAGPHFDLRGAASE